MAVVHTLFVKNLVFIFFTLICGAAAPFSISNIYCEKYKQKFLFPPKYFLPANIVPEERLIVYAYEKLFEVRVAFSPPASCHYCGRE